LTNLKIYAILTVDMDIRKVYSVGHSWAVTIPKDLWLSVGVKPGDYIVVVQEGERICLEKIALRRAPRK